MTALNKDLAMQFIAALRDQIDPTIASISTIMVLAMTGAMVLAQLFGQKR